MEKGTEIPVLGHGFVRYLDHIGSDSSIASSARTSYGKQDVVKTAEDDAALIRALYRDRHTSPFEQASITFAIRMPIFIMRQFVRHRTFRINEFSARYKQLPEVFFMPDKWRFKADKKNKQGSTEAPADFNHEWANAVTQTAYDACMHAYRTLLAKNISNELARIVLPVGIFTEITVNIDMNNLIKYFILRDDGHAQYEHQLIAQAMKVIARELFPGVMNCYDRYQFTYVDTQAAPVDPAASI